VFCRVKKKNRTTECTCANKRRKRRKCSALWSPFDTCGSSSSLSPSFSLSLSLSLSLSFFLSFLYLSIHAYVCTCMREFLSCKTNSVCDERNCRSHRENWVSPTLIRVARALPRRRFLSLLSSRSFDLDLFIFWPFPLCLYLIPSLFAFSFARLLLCVFDPPRWMWKFKGLSSNGITRLFGRGSLRKELIMESRSHVLAKKSLRFARRIRTLCNEIAMTSRLIMIRENVIVSYTFIASRRKNAPTVQKAVASRDDHTIMRKLKQVLKKINW